MKEGDRPNWYDDLADFAPFISWFIMVHKMRGATFDDVKELLKFMLEHPQLHTVYWDFFEKTIHSKWNREKFHELSNRDLLL